ncbi:Protein kinase domain-containing protein [Heracleum sosnowskyi]|uniref:mitogen-activated protein kinase kinase kinase n=1 Tax=Heracleum sosnowskyi TaxID=360622 RepID=A0AAD8H772_9APIA|nr:Protein kinase domain-containing protein [Heracleum sosnowskyi]
MHQIPRLFKHKSMESKHKKSRKPKLDRRNALKNVDYEPSTSNSGSFDSPDSPIRSRSLDISPINDRTSFRIEGIDGEFDVICQSLGLSGPDDFAIPAADWESRKLRSSSDILPRSRLNKLDKSFRISELSHKFSENVSVSDRDREKVDNESVRVGNVGGSDRDEVDNEFLRVGNVNVSDRDEVDNEFVRIGNVNVSDRGEVGNEFVRVSNVRGINGARPPVLTPPPNIALPVIDDNSSTWDIMRSFAPDGDENHESVYGRGDSSSDEDGGGGGNGERERNMVSEDNMFTTSNEDDSSSTTTEPPSNVSPQGKSRPIISSWEKGKLLGRGSFGSVYEGIADGGFFLAVKEVSLLDQGVQGRQSITQLEQEIDLLSKLEHENIVRYLGTEQTESNLYIFLELASKGSLLSLYQQYNLQDSQVSVYTRQILNGLKYLHDKNVVHRDIKSANILVDTNGTVKLADFGLAKATKLNDVKSCKGTAFWMAPEVVKRSQGYGLAADIWSLGCTVLELLTRELPYHPLDGMQAVYRIGNSIPPSVPDSLSKDARDFIHKISIPSHTGLEITIKWKANENELATTSGSIIPALDRE